MRFILLALALILPTSAGVASMVQPKDCLCLQVVSNEGVGGILIATENDFDLLVRAPNGKLITFNYRDVIASKWVSCSSW